MKRQDGTTVVNDDEWYTGKDTADVVADWLMTKGGLNANDPILCPADLLLDGSESQIPISLRNRGFNNVRVTRNLPLDPLFSDVQPNEIIVTNPPFSLLVPFRDFLIGENMRFCFLSRPGNISGYPIVELKDRFRSTDGRCVTASWMQNLVDTRSELLIEDAIGDCGKCEAKKCPFNRSSGDWVPGRSRPLYGWGQAVKYGICGNWCSNYWESGKNKFLRFFDSGANMLWKERT